ncbi:hypothetical protein PR202_ga12036 [Eleusine coracana subsp. coracana]|uniref:DUF4220 domain-containing protein n=1 Tax=Eleusine coracana subsp. coracana TaxID=191504 RepID=A0AAV5CB43_ELECO|nr:hypothetical protein PR202_ga12036 [Eleusine coracana subsp. coracana]
MKVDDVINVWNKWGIRAVVLLSFILQIFLLVLGEIRRRSSSTTLRVFLWLAYLLADSTAIYALGHLSVVSGSREHQLVAFWAPFLLLHLGGPDNITAYALEDNSLWLRHLQTLFVQVLGAAYVIYLYMSSSEILLLLGASIAMFVAGLLKYSERIWALYCGNISSIRDNFNKTDHEVNPLRFVTAGTSRTREVLLKAHYNFSVCQSVFLDTTLEPGDVEPGLGPINVGVEIYKLVELELSLMYDILYTKAPVIHTRYGFCIRFISLIGTSIAFFLFQLSISISSTGSGYDADVIISYVLLVGALTLEDGAREQTGNEDGDGGLVEQDALLGHILRDRLFVSPTSQGISIAKPAAGQDCKQLFDLGTYDTLKLILGLWVEMMAYAADHCNRDSHARQLSNGGEFLTIVWLLIHHQIYIERYNESIATSSDLA